VQLQDPSLSSWKGHGSQGRGKKASVMVIFKKGKEKHPGNNWPISLTSVPMKIMEPVFLEAMSKQVKDRKVTGNRHHGCSMGSLCLTSLTASVVKTKLAVGYQQCPSRASTKAYNVHYINDLRDGMECPSTKFRDNS